MELHEAVLRRSSIRSFSEQAVPRELLEDLVLHAAQAPTASNLQAWRFLVCDDAELVRAIDSFSPGLSGNPSVIIVIMSDMAEAEARGSENSRIYGCMMDASMAAENLMLRAADLGLGTCAIKSYNDAAVREILDLPDTYRVELLVSLGYPARTSRKPARKPLEQVLFFNRVPVPETGSTQVAEAATGRGYSADELTGTAEQEKDLPAEIELLIYMIASAAGLVREPRSYGPVRLIDSARRLAVLLTEREDTDRRTLQRIVDIIDAGRTLSMSDPQGFVEMLSQAAAAATHLLK
ncbi:MAG: nitroreductase family protein [Lachnospiraceae bacterium]|nr:nitroreductase family protein [Lachnospiraceae bacterium]